MGNDREAILVASFGTSHKETEKKTIGAIEDDVRRAYPQCQVRRAYTSPTIRRILKNRDGVSVDNVPEALERLCSQGFSSVTVLPTHIIHGIEYETLLADSAPFASRFTRFQVAAPLLSTWEDHREACLAVLAQLPRLSPRDALVLMGHGTPHHSDTVYAALDYRFKRMGHENVFVGTVEGYPSLDEVLPMVQSLSPQRVFLMPFMTVAGDHAKNDMAGDGPQSWKSRFARRGIEAVCVLKGLGELPEIRAIFLRHLEESRKRHQD